MLKRLSSSLPPSSSSASGHRSSLSLQGLDSAWHFGKPNAIPWPLPRGLAHSSKDPPCHSSDKAHGTGLRRLRCFRRWWSHWCFVGLLGCSLGWCRRARQCWPGLQEHNGPSDRAPLLPPLRQSRRGCRSRSEAHRSPPTPGHQLERRCWCSPALSTTLKAPRPRHHPTPAPGPAYPRAGPVS